MMKTMMGRGRKYFSVKNVFLVALLLFFIFLLSRYFMRGWYEGMTTAVEEDTDKDAKVVDVKADKKDNKDMTDKKDNKDGNDTKDSKDSAGTKDTA